MNPNGVGESSHIYAHSSYDKLYVSGRATRSANDDQPFQVVPSFKFKYIDINKFICQTVIVAENRCFVIIFVCVRECFCVMLLLYFRVLIDHLFCELV